MWKGGDISVRYERARLTAQGKFDAEQSNATASDSNLSTSLVQPQKLTDDTPSSSRGLQTIPGTDRQSAPLTKGELQVADSRQQVLEDNEAGGIEVLLEESHEERDARRLLSRDRNRRKTTNSISGTESLKGLRDRVAGSMHGRAGGIIGMESNR